MKTKTIIIILLAIFALPAILVSIILLSVLFKPESDYEPMVDGYHVTPNWTMVAESIAPDWPSRKHFYLQNNSTNERFQLSFSILYTDAHDYMGKVISNDKGTFLITKYDNEGSADVTYYSVFKITPEKVERLNKQMIWACYNPELNNERLDFYGHRTSEDECDYILTYLPFNKVYKTSVDLK